jgi:hypothetical protein
VSLAVAACGRLDEHLEHHRETFDSLGATTAAVSEAWLAGNVSGTYARTALDKTFRLVEQERAALAGSPQALVDPRGAQLSQAAERFSRLLAAMMHDVRGADVRSVRQHLTEIPFGPAGHR